MDIQAHRLAVNSEAIARREEARAAFIKKHGLTPENAAKLGWNGDDLVGLVDAVSTP